MVCADTSGGKCQSCVVRGPLLRLSAMPSSSAWLKTPMQKGRANADSDNAPMLYATLKAIHVLAIVVWVGGMVFSHFFLRPALAQLEPPQRLRLMHDVLGRFFRAVLVASLLSLGTGIWMIGRVAKQAVQSGGSFQMPLTWTLMAVLGVLMVAIFMHIRFALYARLGRAVAASDWPAGAAALAQVRQWVTINLGMGLLIIVVVLVGPAS